jgi:uncharacterized iron-regulated membrane protein
MHFKNIPLRKLCGQLHLWLGMASGLVILILGITGCVYTFIDELKPLVYQDRLVIPTVPSSFPIPMLPLQELKTKAQHALNKKIPLLDIEVFTDKQRSMVFRYRERNDSANWYNDHFISYDKVYLNPYTGEILKVEDTKWEFFNLVVMLHCTLLLGYLGKQIITWSTIIFILMLSSGIILWWPKNKAASKQRFSFKWTARTRWRRKNYDLHQVLGFYIFVIAFFIALSGLSMLLPKLDQAIQNVVNGERIDHVHPLFPHHALGSKENLLANGDILDKLLKQSMAMVPDAVEHRIYTPENKTAPINVKSYLDKSGHYADVSHSYDQQTGRHLTHQEFVSLSAGEKVHELTYDIHVGAVLMLPGKILAFMVSLITASLPVSGFLIWRGKRK